MVNVLRIYFKNIQNILHKWHEDRHFQVSTVCTALLHLEQCNYEYYLFLSWGISSSIGSSDYTVMCVCVHGFRCFKNILKIWHLLFQVFYVVVMSFFPLMDRRCKKMKHLGNIIYHEYLHSKIMLGVYLRAVHYILSKK